MTMEDELRKLTSTSAAKEAEETRQRSNFRSPIRDWEGDVVDIAGPYEVRRGNNTQKVVKLKVENLVVTKSVTPYTDRTAELEMNLPKEANIHGEIGQMVASANAINSKVDSLLDLKGAHLNCQERVHKYPGRRNSGRKDGMGRDVWVDDDFTTFYYHVNAIGGVSANGGGPVVAAPAEANPGTLAAVLQFANGLTEEQFNQSVLRDLPAAAADPVTRGKIIGRTFLKEAVETGLLAVNDGTYTAVPAEEPATA